MLSLRCKVRPTRKRLAAFDVLEDRTVPATYQWTGAGANANWNTPANWTLISGTGTFPNAAGDIAQFSAAYTANQTPVLTSAVTVGEIDFGGAAYTGNFGVDITGGTGGSLVLKNTGGAAAVINVNSSGNTTVAPITISSFAGGLTATSGGLKVTLNSAKLNLTFSGAIRTGSFAETAVVNAGTLVQNNNAPATTIGATSTFTVNSGGTLSDGSNATFADSVSNYGLGQITLNDGSTLQANASTNPVLLQNNIVLGSAASVILANAPFLFQGGTITLTGNDTLKVNSKTLTGTVSPVLTTIADTIVGSGSSPNKLTFGPLGTGTPSLGDVTFAGSVPLTITGHPIVLANSTAYPGATSTTPTFTVKTPTTISSSLSGTVSALTIAGSSTLTLGAANTYVGGTNVSSGTLVLGVSNALPVTTNLSLGSASGNGTVDLDGNGQTVAGLSIGVGASATSQIIGNSSTAAGSTLTFAGGSNAASTFAGTLQDTLGAGTNTLSLAVSSGALTLTGNNTYTGSTTVNGGSLTVDGTLASPAGVVVAAGATLAGSGVIVGPVSASGILSAGDLVTGGTLSTGNLTFAAGSTLSVGEIGAGNDEVVVSGTADLGNATIALAPGTYAGVPGTAFTILHTTGGLLATPATQPDGTILTNGTQFFQVHYGTNDITLQYLVPAGFATPEAATFTAGVAGSFNVQTVGYPAPGPISESPTDVLPSGVTFANGVFSGTPAPGSDGIYLANLTIANGIGDPTTQTFVLFVGPITTVYVSNANFGLNSPLVAGQYVASGDLSGSGNTPGVFGVSAFATIADAVNAVGSTGTVVVNAGSYPETPNLTGTVTLQLSGNVTFDALDSAAGATVDLQGNTLTVGTGTGTHTIVGAIVGTGGSLVKVGSDSLTLGGTDTYTGPTTVSAGSLIVDGSLGSSAVSITGSGTLGGAGSIGAVTSANIVNPGASGTSDNLTVGSLTLGSGALVLDLASAGSDSVTALTSLDITGTTLSLNVGTITPGESFTILTVPGIDATSRQGTFANLPDSNSSFTVGTLTFTINYAGGDGNDIVLTASGSVPTLNGIVLNGNGGGWVNVTTDGVTTNTFVPGYIESTAAGNQHSMVESVVYSFAQGVSLSTANFSLTGLPGSGTTVAPNVVLTPNSDNTVWTVTFAGTGVNTATHSIGDGEYQLVLSGLPGLTNNTYDFYRLLGDIDGSGGVDSGDLLTLNGTFLRSPSDPGYLGAMDFDGSNSVDSADLLQFDSNFLHTVPTLPNGGGT